jgi:hypothetical protein
VLAGRPLRDQHPAMIIAQHRGHHAHRRGHCVPASAP